MYTKTSILIEHAFLEYFEEQKSKKPQSYKRFILPKEFGHNFNHFSIAKELGFKPEVVLLDVPFKILYKRAIK